MSAKLLLLLIILQAFTVFAQGGDQEVVFAPLLSDDSAEHKPKSTNQNRVYNQETLTFRAMVRAQNLAKAAYLNEKYGEYFTSGETIFSEYTSQEFHQMFTGGILKENNAVVTPPSKAQIRNLQGDQDINQVQQPEPQPDSPLYAENNDHPDPIPEPDQPLNIQANNYQSVVAKPQILGGVVPTVFAADWTTGAQILVTNVKNQGGCGSCWAFAGTAQYESYQLKYNKAYLDLSEQQVTECALPNGCGGGYLDSFAIYATINAIAFENVYPYKATSPPTACADNAAKRATGTYKVNNFLYITNCNMMTDVIVNHGPATVCMTADNNWQNYLTGVIPSCSPAPSGHCVLLVGATSDGTGTISANTNFWKYRNSWGTGWGEAGFFRSYRNPNDSASGYCGFCRSGLITLPN